MYLNTTKDHLKILLKNKTPVFMWGPPGIGKSSIVRQVCDEKKWEMIDLRLSLLNPVDLRGLPFMGADRKTAVWLHPEFLPKKGKGVLFLDELNTAPTSVQIAAYQLVLDRRIGNYIFPEEWRIIAAGNRETDMAFISKMPSPLANRFIHIETEANIDDWKMWAQGKVDPRIVAFLSFRPKLLCELPKEEIRSYPTPRSWAFVSKILSLYKNPEDAEEIINGTVGEGSAKELLGFLNIYKELPDIDEILEGKVKRVPNKADVLYALVSALVTKLKIVQVDNFINYALNLPPEFSTLAIRDAAKKGVKWEAAINESSPFERWVKKFGEYI